MKPYNKFCKLVIEICYGNHDNKARLNQKYTIIIVEDQELINNLTKVTKQYQ